MAGLIWLIVFDPWSLLTISMNAVFLGAAVYAEGSRLLWSLKKGRHLACTSWLLCTQVRVKVTFIDAKLLVPSLLILNEARWNVNSLLPYFRQAASHSLSVHVYLYHIVLTDLTKLYKTLEILMLPLCFQENFLLVKVTFCTDTQKYMERRMWLPTA